jgi:hypothetical protein
MISKFLRKGWQRLPRSSRLQEATRSMSEQPDPVGTEGIRPLNELMIEGDNDRIKE